MTNTVVSGLLGFTKLLTLFTQFSIGKNVLIRSTPKLQILHLQLNHANSFLENAYQLEMCPETFPAFYPIKFVKISRTYWSRPNDGDVCTLLVAEIQICDGQPFRTLSSYCQFRHIVDWLFALSISSCACVMIRFESPSVCTLVSTYVKHTLARGVH